MFNFNYGVRIRPAARQFKTHKSLNLCQKKHFKALSDILFLSNLIFGSDYPYVLSNRVFVWWAYGNHKNYKNIRHDLSFFLLTRAWQTIYEIWRYET